ncbi:MULTISPECIES: DUF4123 domain-containing protein [unclassified Pseudomonas]|uniref:DUF4123 domain-containing protein n=1 Tax=unclassified Pseudomonas TaxID=196821 RepID=UPI002AC8D72D|nr:MULTISPECIES: DUF4123 domain-containing protein [unclassified Pseudomonas]MEB0048061.1 DUF4123 domain-containing protein [Pseudomonas sp. Dout3]MEB0099617.1 DUF4123 domain-containing protein [Pseudomonas sp. DC1.2]WPX59162.1 DUF4123 domain-containing protein [Pseudomonas sp. DC1.2]
MFDLPPLPDDLPWTMPAYLLLDGVSASNLAQRLHRWNNPAYCLYQGTRWQALSDISPYLILLNGAHDSLLAYYQEHAALEWGYLLFSAAEATTLCKHWRRLLSVEHPSGIEVMPRIADPAVMHQLLGLAAQAPDACWFGPVEHVCLPDALQASWHQHTRPAHLTPQSPQTYRLTDQELTALGEVEFRHRVFGLSEHLHTHFPTFMASSSVQERLCYAHQMAQEAYRQGFTSEQEITLYANVFGSLAGQPLADHADIVELLTASTAQSPLPRVQRAAELAQRRVIDPQGSRR